MYNRGAASEATSWLVYRRLGENYRHTGKSCSVSVSCVTCRACEAVSAKFVSDVGVCSGSVSYCSCCCFSCCCCPCAPLLRWCATGVPSICSRVFSFFCSIFRVFCFHRSGSFSQPPHQPSCVCCTRLRGQLTSRCWFRVATFWQNPFLFRTKGLRGVFPLILRSKCNFRDYSRVKCDARAITRSTCAHALVCAIHRQRIHLHASLASRNVNMKCVRCNV